MEEYYLATFHSVSQALRFEKTVLALGKEVRLLPVPRIISSSCGVAARFPREMLDEVLGYSREGLLEMEDIYLFSGQGRALQAQRLNIL